jgi:hypothetical protein
MQIIAFITKIGTGATIATDALIESSTNNALHRAISEFEQFFR